MIEKVSNSVIREILETENDGTFTVPIELMHKYIYTIENGVYVCCYCDRNFFIEEFDTYEDMIEWVNE